MKRILSMLMVLAWLLGAVSAPADDTDVYGVSTVEVQPNVLIIFDNSGSMGTEDVPGEYYNPATTYAGSYTSTAVYGRYKSKGKYYFTKFADDVSQLNCPDPKNALQTVGYVTAAVRTSAYNFTCGGTEVALFLGNWLNYDASGAGDMRTRLSVAKEVIGNLIDTTDNVRFGLMVFNTDQGGRVVRPIGASQADLLASIDALNASTWTPLSETLAEAGLYYAGKKSWFNTGVSYTSPMQYTCQKNYIILMTDGEPTMDNDSRVATGAYINGDAIGDYDGDGKDPGTYASYGTDYLDDVAAYLYENDLNLSLGVAGESFERQNVITYTIGFRTAQQLLQDTAANGGGKYYTANSISGLSAAFEEILGEIADVNSVFVAPVVPVSRMNRTYAGNNIYIGFFKPRVDGRWFGNIKKYGIDNQGELVDVDGVLATLSNGEIKDNAQSYWSLEPDGPNVAKGGLGGLLINQPARNLYTYLGTSTALTHASNAFVMSNTAMTETHLAVGSATEREAVINDIHGENRDWIMGDILHSEPAIVHYSDGQSIIFAGSNDGMMHCFRDSDGAELWGFIPPEQLGRLKNLSDTNTTHDYFTDGSPKVHTMDSGQKILFFGERRGSNMYYALDVTDYTAPVWLYTVSPTILGGGAALLGHSWGNPPTMKIMSGGVEETVILLPGGYDPNQDLAPPAATDAVGRAAFALKLSNGTVAGFNFNAGNYADMTHSITDVTGLDSDGDRLVNRIYAPDMKGQMFAFEDDDKDGSWSRRKLFSASADGVHRKMFYAPDIVIYTPTSTTLGDRIYFGTGDRENPTDTSVVNRFYAIKNDWQAASADLTEADLYDATANLIQMGDEAQKLAAKEAINNAKGWFFELPNLGEKVISAPIVYGGVVYFTTYSPETGVVAVSDPCAVAGGRGTARLYAVDYLTGAAVMNYSDVTETDGDGNTIGSDGASPYGLLDRCQTVGTSIPSAPVIAILESGAQIYIGVEGGVRNEDAKKKADMQTYFWREVNTN